MHAQPECNGYYVIGTNFHKARCNLPAQTPGALYDSMIFVSNAHLTKIFPQE